MECMAKEEEANKSSNNKDKCLSPNKQGERKFFASINEDLNEEAVALKKIHLQKFWKWKVFKWKLR